MNQTLEKIMTFINENTNILIGICLFLIFVLIGYLIDNSIKSRKAKKEFMKSQITKEPKTENDIKIEEPKNINDSNDIQTNLFENAISTPENIINLEENDLETYTDTSINNEIKSTFEENKNEQNIETNNLNDVIGAIDTISAETENIDLSNEDQIEKADVSYKNDKKLSEILFSDATKEEQSKNIDFNDISNNIDNNIFSDEKIVSKDIEPKKVEPKVEIELDENELDNIMKKLKNLSNVEEDDNYTNIF